MISASDDFSPKPEPMKYMLLGQDGSSTAEKLEAHTGRVAWEYLRPHYERGALWFIDPELPLETVGAAIAENDKAKVEAWLKSGDMVKIEEIHAAQWENGNGEFDALVVSPFVLFRPVTSDS